MDSKNDLVWGAGVKVTNKEQERLPSPMQIKRKRVVYLEEQNYRE